MNIVTTVAALVLGLLVLLFVGTRIGAWIIERRNPPAGEFIEVLGTRLHYVHVPAGADQDLPPVVFVHGASANLLDQMLPMRPLLEGRAELLFFDRPGHGWSERGEMNETPNGQARTIAALLDRVGIARAIVVGHSFGGGIAAAFALAYPERVSGLVFLSSATHPWDGGETSWYYPIAAHPIFGPVFTALLTLPAGFQRIGTATESVFEPNPVPPTYLRDAGIVLVLRPGAFRANATDVENLHAHVTAAAPRYGEIKVPTVVISGDSDTVVYEELHSLGLKRDLPDAELVWICGLGHKPDWVAPDLVVASIEKVAGQARDLQTMARQVEARIVKEIGPRNCVSPEEAAKRRR